MGEAVSLIALQITAQLRASPAPAKHREQGGWWQVTSVRQLHSTEVAGSTR